MAQSGFVRARLESGVRDEKGRFRIAQGTSSLHVPDPAKKGLTIAELQAQASGLSSPHAGRARLARLKTAAGGRAVSATVPWRLSLPQVDAERKVKEEARMAKKRKADSTVSLLSARAGARVLLVSQAHASSPCEQGASTAPKERAGKGADASHGGEEWQSTWVVPGIVVKIMSKENKDIYKLKGVRCYRCVFSASTPRSRTVASWGELPAPSRASPLPAAGAVRVIAREGDKGDVVATVELDDGSEHKVHSRDLETVIPAVGGTARRAARLTLSHRREAAAASARVVCVNSARAPRVS